MSDDVAKLIEEAQRQGWRVVRGTKHWKLFAPDGITMVTIATTPGARNSIARTVAIMRRAGFVWKGH